MSINIEELEETEAIGWGGNSCVGVHATEKDFPLNHGNYFSLVTKDSSYEIANFWAEDLKYLLAKDIVEYPIKLKILKKEGKSWALIHDIRIPHEFYSEISHRAPHEFWSIPQLARSQRDIDSGVLQILGDGLEARHVVAEKRTLNVKWSSEAAEDLKPMHNVDIESNILQGYKGKDSYDAGYIIPFPGTPGTEEE